MENKASKLTVNNLNKFYGTVQAVKDFSITVEPSEFLVLLGPSGCGKTTALRMMAGLEATSSGQIIISEEDVTNLQPKYRDIAMVFQSYALYPHKTVAENIGFPFKVRGIKGKERDNAVKEAASQVRMEHLLDRYPKQLSGGERQRVALARAIVRRPAVFLMDEPLSNLDAKLRIYMRAELKRMQHELGVTTVYVTHDQVEAMTLAHRVAIMNHGVLQQVGSPREVYDKPSNLFVAGFMGSPPMNLISGVISNEVLEAQNTKILLSGIDMKGDVVLGFRPENAEIVGKGNGQFDAKVYTTELAGDHSLVTLMLGEISLTVKMSTEFEAEYDSIVGVQFENQKSFIFDEKSGKRLEPTI